MRQEQNVGPSGKKTCIEYLQQKCSVIFVLIYFLVLVFQLFFSLCRFSFHHFFVLVLVLVLPMFFSFSFVLVLQYFFVLVLSVICLSVSVKWF